MPTYSEKAEMSPTTWILSGIGIIIVVLLIAWALLQEADEVKFVPRSDYTTTTTIFITQEGG